MVRKLKPHQYQSSLLKRIFDLMLATLGTVLLLPLFIIISVFVKLTSNGPLLFNQLRLGKDGKTFVIIMFRTMYAGGELDQEKYRHLNEADGPVFKIGDDPRFVGIGKFLARSGLDELPQLFNVIMGEMSLVGPRPLPVKEAKALTKVQRYRELVKPGMTSSWVISGAHRLSFKKWTKLDQEYIKNATLSTDIEILLKTLILVPKLLFKK